MPNLPPAAHVVLLSILISSLHAQEAKPPAVVGRWDLTLIGGDGRHLPSWIEIEWSGDRVLVGRFLAVVGSARPVSKFDFTNDTLKWSAPPQWEGGNGDFQFTGVYANDSLTGTLTTPDGKQLSWSGHRAPAMERKSPPTWSVQKRLFNGRDLTGWHVSGGENHWKALPGGVLSNTQHGGNLVTDATFGDFKLHLEFRYPKDGNSGVYLHGRHEVQVEDTVGHPRSTTSIAGVYGLLLPNQNAAKGAGEWQTYDITLVGRVVTVVLNGKRVICEQEIPGPTGGALDSDEGAPGPIMLQGDHTAVDYRNIVITPAR